MIAYEFYWVDEKRGFHFFGLLPEKRKNLERITKESILNWGKEVSGEDSDINNLYFIQMEM